MKKHLLITTLSLSMVAMSGYALDTSSLSGMASKAQKTASQADKQANSVSSLNDTTLPKEFRQPKLNAKPSRYELYNKVYVGVGYGYSHGDVESKDLSNISVNDQSDKGYLAFVGYQFNPYLSAEAGYVNFGDVKLTSNTGSGNQKGNLENTGYYLAAVGTLHLYKGLALTGRLGGIRTTTKAPNFLSFSSTDPNDHDNTQYGLLYGLGIQYYFTPYAGLSLNWLSAHYRHKTDSDVMNTNSLLSANFLIRF